MLVLPLGSMVAAVSADTLDALQGVLTRLGPWGAPLYCAFLVLSGIFPLPGFGMLVVASGFLFGFPYGFFLVYPSAVLGAVLSFAVGRRIPSSWLSHMPKKLVQLQGAVSQGGFTTLLLLRLTPLPFAFSNLLLGSTQEVSCWSHAAATALGFLRLALNSYLGTTMYNAANDGGGSLVERAVTIGGTVCAIAAVSSVGRRMLAQAAQPHSGKAD